MWKTHRFPRKMICLRVAEDRDKKRSRSRRRWEWPTVTFLGPQPKMKRGGSCWFSKFLGSSNAVCWCSCRGPGVRNFRAAAVSRSRCLKVGLVSQGSGVLDAAMDGVTKIGCSAFRPRDAGPYLRIPAFKNHYLLEYTCMCNTIYIYIYNYLYIYNVCNVCVMYV